MWKKNSSMYFHSFSSILNSEQKWSFGFIGILDNVFDACVEPCQEKKLLQSHINPVTNGGYQENAVEIR